MDTGLGELLPVVNREDQEVGLEHRVRIHELGLMHRTVHVLVFDHQRRVYLQQRSLEKDTYPGYWTSSVSGHVDQDEKYLQAAYRELREELGLVEPCIKLGKLLPQPATDQAFAAVYAVRTSMQPLPNYREIMGGHFFSQRQAWALARDLQQAVPILRLVLALAGSRGFFQR